MGSKLKDVIPPYFLDGVAADNKHTPKDYHEKNLQLSRNLLDLAKDSTTPAMVGILQKLNGMYKEGYKDLQLRFTGMLLLYTDAPRVMEGFVYLMNYSNFVFNSEEELPKIVNDFSERGFSKKLKGFERDAFTDKQIVSVVAPLAKYSACSSPYHLGMIGRPNWSCSPKDILDTLYLYRHKPEFAAQLGDVIALAPSFVVDQIVNDFSLLLGYDEGQQESLLNKYGMNVRIYRTLD